MVQSQIGAISGWLHGQSAEVVSAAITSLRKAPAKHVDGTSVPCPVRCRWSAACPPERALPGASVHRIDALKRR